MGTGDASKSSSRYSSSESFWNTTGSTGSGDGDRGRFRGGSSAARSASRRAATPRHSAANIGESDAASGADAASETHCAAVIAARYAAGRSETGTRRINSKMRRVTCVVGSGPRSRITTRAGGARAGRPQLLPCWIAAGGWSKVRPQPAGQGKRPMSARYVSAPRRRRRRCVVAGLPTRDSAPNQGSAPGLAGTDAAARAALRGQPKGRLPLAFLRLRRRRKRSTWQRAFRVESMRP